MPEATYDLTPTRYDYRGHTIAHEGIVGDGEWFVYAADDCVYNSCSVDDCKAAIDEVCDS